MDTYMNGYIHLVFKNVINTLKLEEFCPKIE